MAKTLEERIEAAKLEEQQAKNLVKQLTQQQKAQQRKARTKRFCERAGYLEKILPDTALLTKEQFQEFLNDTLLTSFSGKILKSLLASDTADKAENSGDTVQGGGKEKQPDTAA